MRAFLLLNYVSKDKMTLIRCLSVKAVNEAKSFEQDFFQNKLNSLETRGIASKYAHKQTAAKEYNSYVRFCMQLLTLTVDLLY